MIDVVESWKKFPIRPNDLVFVDVVKTLGRPESRVEAVRVEDDDWLVSPLATDLTSLPRAPKLKPVLLAARDERDERTSRDDFRGYICESGPIRYRKSD